MPSSSCVMLATIGVVDPLLFELLPKLSFHFDGFLVSVASDGGASPAISECTCLSTWM